MSVMTTMEIGFLKSTEDIQVQLHTLPIGIDLVLDICK